jgi:hypothetical protein
MNMAEDALKELSKEDPGEAEATPAAVEVAVGNDNQEKIVNDNGNINNNQQGGTVDADFPVSMTELQVETDPQQEEAEQQQQQPSSLSSSLEERDFVFSSSRWSEILQSPTSVTAFSPSLDPGRPDSLHGLGKKS